MVEIGQQVGYIPRVRFILDMKLGELFEDPENWHVLNDEQCDENDLWKGLLDTKTQSVQLRLMSKQLCSLRQLGSAFKAVGCHPLSRSVYSDRDTNYSHQRRQRVRDVLCRFAAASTGFGVWVE